jgi:multiple sugar transport system permease protein
VLARASRTLSSYLFVLPALVFVFLTMIYPLVFNFQLSLTDADLVSFVRGASVFIGFENYARLLRDAELQNALTVSIVYTLGSISLMYVLGFGLALYFDQRFGGRAMMRALMLLPWVLPTVVSANIWRWMLDGTYGVVNYALIQLGLLDAPIFWLGNAHVALISVIVVTAWSIAPFAMLLLLAGLQAIPSSLYEAARVDGASAWQRFRHITFPLMRPVSLMVLLLNFIYTFKTFDTIFILTRGGPGDVTTVLPILAYARAFQFFRLAEGAAVNTILLVLPVVLSVVYFRIARREGEL